MRYCKFSGFWPVKDNPKHTAKLGHVKHARNKGLDFFISSSKINVARFPTIIIPSGKLPSLPHISNLESFCLDNKQVRLKFGAKVKGTTFFELATIWTSKILLFKEILIHSSDFEAAIWVDCIRSLNLDLIEKCPVDDKVVINKYDGAGHDSFTPRPFGDTLPGPLSREISSLPVKLSACTIRIPNALLPLVSSLYVECLLHTDSKFNIYDEEIVLSFMYAMNPDIFYIINP
jgi:hypothetical protein